jgi:hypothetical protein
MEYSCGKGQISLPYIDRLPPGFPKEKFFQAQ